MARIVEDFFSIQGEGQRAGKPSLFIRLFGCNLCCVGFGQPDPADPSTYHKVEFKKNESPKYGCDSPHSWHPMYKEDCSIFTTGNSYAQHLISKYEPWQLRELVITGGEPMLQQPFLIKMLEELVNVGIPVKDVTIETNGSVVPESAFIEFFQKEASPRLLMSVSPKLNCVAGVNENISINYNSLKILTSNETWNYQLKFVYNGDDRASKKIDEILHNLEQEGVNIERNQVLLMPVGAHITEHNLMVTTAEYALSKGFSYCPRLHVDIWGKKTGV